MDPISAVGFAASILTFVDFSWSLVKGSHEIYRSMTGASTDHAQISTVLDNLEGVTNVLQFEVKPTSPHRIALKELAKGCAAVSQELSSILEDLKRKEGNKVWRSLEAQWKVMRKEKTVASIEQRLGSFRLDLLLRLNLIISEEHLSLNSRLREIREMGVTYSSNGLVRLTAAQEETKTLITEISEYLQSIGSGQAASLTEICAGLSTVMSTLDSIPKPTTVENRILKRLYFPSMHNRVEKVADTEFGTFKWLLEDDTDSEDSEVSSGGGSDLANTDKEIQLRHHARQSFLTWLETGSQIFHISGKAGSGKSTLMKFLCQNPCLQAPLKEWAGSKKLVFASFFFWNSGDHEQRSLKGLYQSLLFEILTQCPDLIKKVFPEYCTRASTDVATWDNIPFSASELRDAMTLIVGQRSFPNHRFCFFIDGLDEFEVDSNTDHWKLAQHLRNWTASPDIKICVSSRPHEEFLQGSDPKLRIHLHELTRGDVHRFVHATLAKTPNYDKTHMDISEISESVVRRADGVFLWVHLVVRSLADGIRRRYSTKMLDKRLEQIPTKLESLFDQLFNSIDPGDRERSDKMLLLAASDKCPNEAVFDQDRPLNALMFSWLDNLEDPDYPFSEPICAYSDDEIRHRQGVVSSQLDGLSKGLLELRVEHSSSDNDIYFEQTVDFFHRTVREYLNSPERLAAIKSRLGPQFDIIEMIRRLCLAEFKFARTSSRALSGIRLSYRNLYTSFAALFRFEDVPITSRFLDEYERVLEHHRQTPFTHPTEAGHINPGVIDWPQWQSTGLFFIPPGQDKVDVSYIHLLARLGHYKYVMDRVMADRSLILPRDGMSLLFTASLCMDGLSTPKLTRDLLDAGASPNEPIWAPFSGTSTIWMDEEPGDEGWFYPHVTTAWTALLFILAKIFFGKNRNRPWTDQEVSNTFLTVEEYLKAGADCDIYFILLHRSDIDILRDRKAHRIEIEPGNGHSPAQLVIVRIEDIILHIQPPNLDILMKYLQDGKDMVPVQETTETADMTLHIKETLGEVEYRQANANSLESMKGDYVVNAAVVNGRWLERGFLVRWC